MLLSIAIMVLFIIIHGAAPADQGTDLNRNGLHCFKDNGKWIIRKDTIEDLVGVPPVGPYSERLSSQQFTVMKRHGNTQTEIYKFPLTDEDSKKVKKNKKIVGVAIEGSDVDADANPVLDMELIDGEDKISITFNRYETDKSYSLDLFYN